MISRAVLAGLVVGTLAVSTCVAQADVAGLSIEKRPSLHAIPVGVSVEQTAASTRISGQVRRLSTSPSRRLYGRVRIEAVDAMGESLFVSYADLRRCSPARHTSRAKFSIEIASERVREARVLRVGYGLMDGR